MRGDPRGKSTHWPIPAWLAFMNETHVWLIRLYMILSTESGSCTAYLLDMSLFIYEGRVFI